MQKAVHGRPGSLSRAGSSLASVVAVEAAGTRTTVTVQGASATTCDETLPR
jgi:hypothetical protein